MTKAHKIYAMIWTNSEHWKWQNVRLNQKHTNKVYCVYHQNNLKKIYQPHVKLLFKVIIKNRSKFPNFYDIKEIRENRR